MTLEQFNNEVLAQNPEAIYLLRFEQLTPFGKAYFNGISYMEFTDEYEEEYRPALITEKPIEEDYVEVIASVDIQEINLAAMTIIANSIRRRYDL